ncbi:hypothetical protein Bbelb_380500 [Branchiostoma belcheri]|nr:hypothetical protein Bbelb_380500 [Branchiostoma belcheri]
MLRVCEKLHEADEKGRRYGLARVETGYLRALVDAMADTDRLAEVEMLKTLGDVNVEKGRLGKDVGKFNTALALYIAAMVRCYHEEQADGIEHRYHYTERLLQGVSSQGKKQPTEDKETTTPAKVAVKFQALDKRRATGGNTDSLLVSGYAKLMVEAIVKDDSVLETEAIKSLGDVYLKRGTETGDTRNLTRATALYNRALARCHNVHGTVVIVHRLLHTAKIRQYITNTRDKPTMAEAQRCHFPVGMAGQLSDGQRVHCVFQKSTQNLTLLPVLSIAMNARERGELAAKDIRGSSQLREEADVCSPCMDHVSASYQFSQRPSRTQRQKDVRGRKGHFSAFSAAPSNDGTNCQVEDDISYRRYIQTADRDVRNGDLDAAEQNLVAALKLIAVNPTRLKKPTVCEGWVTSTSSEAAALYNASMARTGGGKQNMVAKLQETVRQFLRNTCNLDCEPCPYSSTLDHRKELDNLRALAKSKLETIHQEHNPYQYDEDDPVVREVEIKRAEAIKNLFKSITVRRQEFIQVLTDECIAKLGPPPCKYAFIGMGSQATELVTPYSDLEFAILIEGGRVMMMHGVINLGETILPAMAISSLNDFLSEDPEKDWFFDSVTPRGFAFDGFMPWASKTPFGRDETKSKPPVSLIQTPAKLAEYQHLHIALAEGYHLSDILRRVTYLTGDESLVEDYVERVSKSVDRSPALSLLSAMLILKENDLIREIKNVFPTAQLLDVKKEIYRFPSVAVDVLSICCGITIPSVWGMIEELHKTQRISDEDAHHLTVLISISAELRLRTYIANGGQKDRLSPLTEMKVQLDEHDVDDTFVGSVFHLPDSKMLFRYYYTAIPLKTCISDTIAKENTTTKIFPTAIFDTSSQIRGRISQQLLQFDASKRYFEAALQEASSDEKKQCGILFELGNVCSSRGYYKEAISYYERAHSVGNTLHRKMCPVFVSLLESFGACWSGLGDEKKAISYHEQSLKMAKAIYGETTPHPIIAAALNNIGRCWSKLGDQWKALSYMEQSVKMNTVIHGETTEHPGIASSLNNIGECWSELGDQRKAISYLKQSLKMRKAIYGETTAHPDISSSLNNIGNCWQDLGYPRKAISYHEQSLKMTEIMYGETTPHLDIALSLNNIGNCWTDIGDHRKAIAYHEQSLKMKKAIYGETAPHPDIASSLNNIGNCWRDLSDRNKAMSYHEQSLKMRKTIYGVTTPHPDIAGSLNNIGGCWSDLGDWRKAISYYEQSLKMWKAIYGSTTQHPNIASSLNNIGACWSELGDRRKATRYYEQSLEMWKAIYGESTPHPKIVSLLHNIGACWSDLGEQRKAIQYHEQSLKMRKAIYGETAQHPDIAFSLNSIGNCWSDLGDQRKAISYYEQSLKMRKTIYAKSTPLPKIASSLNNIGNCWQDLGDQRKALSYYEQSLEMWKVVYGETSANPDIASTLNNIVSCWSQLGDQRKAYHDELVKMEKAIYDETTPNPDVASSLNYIGACWSQLGDQKKAISCYNKLLKMTKAIFGENTIDPLLPEETNTSRVHEAQLFYQTHIRVSTSTRFPAFSGPAQLATGLAHDQCSSHVQVEFDFSVQDMFDLLPVTTNLDSSIKMAINSAIGQA